MRLFILGLDGLEYRNVLQWNLRFLMQKYWTVYDSFVEKATPYLWSSMITGVHPDKVLKTDSWTVPVNPVFALVRKYLKFLRGKGLGRYVKKKWVTKEYLSGKTLFDEYKSIVIDFPGYNWEMPKGWISLPDAVGDKVKSKLLFNLVLKRDKEKFMRIIDLINNDWRVFAVWMYSADIVNHLYPLRYPLNDLHERVYYRFDFWVEMISKMIGGDVLLVVISDHGSWNGIHSKKAFVSINRDKDWLDKNGIEMPMDTVDVYRFFRQLIEV